jgi:hypothetical protein
MKPIEKYSLTEGQASLYRFYQLYKDSLAYNMPRVTIVDGKLDVMRFRVAVNELIHGYEVLRMNFQLDGDIPVFMAGGTMEVGVIRNRI